MTNVDQLIAKGGQIVGGDLIFKHKVMGQFRNGDFFLTPDGEAELAVTDVVEVKEVRKPRTRKVEDAVATVDEAVIQDAGVPAEE